MRRIGFVVEGEPAPQGSMAYKGKNKKTGKAIITHSNRDKLVTWRERVVSAAVEALSEQDDRTPLGGPLTLFCSFHLERPKTVKRAEHTVYPDLDKLVRAVGDALTMAKVIEDDARIVEIRARKWYETESSPPGVIVRVYGNDGEES